MFFEGIGQFGNVVFCDDIRREDNGKFLLIGAYSSSMRLREIPAVTFLCVLIEFQAQKLGNMRLDFEFRVGDKKLARYDGSIDQAILDDAAPQYIPLAMPAAHLEIAEECLLELYAISESAEAKIRSLTITRWVDETSS